MKTIVFSSSQTAHSLLDIVRSNEVGSTLSILGILDDDVRKHGREYYGLQVLGSFRDVESLAARGEVSHFILGLAAFKHMLIKGALFRHCRALGLQPLNIVSKRSYLAGTAQLHAGHCVYPMAMVSTDCEIGPNCHISAGVMLMEQTTLAENVSIMGNAFVGGRCRIEENVYVGPGAVIGSEVTIGTGSVVAAGSVVLKNVPASMLVKGNPAQHVPTSARFCYLPPPAWMRQAIL